MRYLMPPHGVGSGHTVKSIVEEYAVGKTVVFAVNRVHAALLKRELAGVDGVQVLVNPQPPEIPVADTVVMARPTNSRRLYLKQCSFLQSDGVLIDLASNILRHGVPQQDCTL